MNHLRDRPAYDQWRNKKMWLDLKIKYTTEFKRSNDEKIAKI